MNTNNFVDITLTLGLTIGVMGSLALAGMGSAVILGAAATAAMVLLVK